MLWVLVRHHYALRMAYSLLEASLPPIVLLNHSTTTLLLPPSTQMHKQVVQR